MAEVIVPRVARIHWLSNTGDFHSTATGLDEKDGLNHVFKAISDLATLAEVIAWLLEVWAATGAEGANLAAMPLGDMHTLADDIKARYPAGYIPAASS